MDEANIDVTGKDWPGIGARIEAFVIILGPGKLN